jgi:hypothetical protein
MEWNCRVRERNDKFVAFSRCRTREVKKEVKRERE